MQKFDIDIVSYQTTQQVVSNCNSIQFINIGTSNLIINNSLTLITNQTFTVEGNEGELCVATFLIKFDNSGTNSVTVVRKNFL